jgi:hypothetical protein
MSLRRPTQRRLLRSNQTALLAGAAVWSEGSTLELGAPTKWLGVLAIVAA